MICENRFFQAKALRTTSATCVPDELLSLCRTAPEEFLRPNKMTFPGVRQGSELLLKGIAWELDRARGIDRRRRFFTPPVCCAAATTCWNIRISMLHELETITYHLIRAGLGHGSGLARPPPRLCLHIGPRSGRGAFSRGSFYCRT